MLFKGFLNYFSGFLPPPPSSRDKDALFFAAFFHEKQGGKSLASPYAVKKERAACAARPKANRLGDYAFFIVKV